ncbi:hypothetical protein [Halorhodospira halophila]|uniref:phage major tropism determinant n=1 Tax=Halorhodospira halophila TaxID=1053 RepID=UPI0019113ECC|nr:hypothetical protein [Halorhodospira halophila]MBK5942707.1 hypothetical protein [Halorhodospira halophila]
MRSIEAAKMPAVAEIMGRMETSGDTRVDVPDMALNIGGHGQGFIIRETLDWEPHENEDGTLGGEMSLGDSVYIYAVAQDSGIAKLVASKNKTAPDGHGTTESRRIGGFHYGRVRTLDQAYDSSTTLDQKIIPNSAWDLRHRPTCDPTGMVEIIPDRLWLDIYLASEDGQGWPDTVPLSAYGATPLSGSEGYALFYDYLRLARNAGKRLPTAQEWHAAAYGVPQGSTDAGGRVSTGEHSDYGFEAVSCLNLDQPSGNLRQTLAELFLEAEANNYTDSVNAGKDESEDHGQAYGTDLRVLGAGGYWSHTDEAGARCVLRAYPWRVASSVGLRCACDSL